jgi:serine protease AprX
MNRALRRSALIIGVCAIVLGPGLPGGRTVTTASARSAKLDPFLQARTSLGGSTRVIVQAAGGGALGTVLSTVRLLGGSVVRPLPLVNGAAIEVPNGLIPVLANSPLVAHISYDRPTVASMERTGVTVGALAAVQQFGYDGSGVGVAVIDSGVTSWHDDLADASSAAQRVDRFVDFVNGGTVPYDDYGHGTHVAGIIAGNGRDSDGARGGLAPGVHLVVLKVLDAAGNGRVSDVINALDYVVAHRSELNIRVVNLSVASGVYESYTTDPLTLAAERAVAAGIVVVAAAGNAGRSAVGVPQYGGITAPGNAPWVLTVGASSHMGTVDRSDDTMAAFSSRGPAAIDANAKPDLVAPGVGIESLSDPHSRLYDAYPQALLPGTEPTSYLPYLSLSGTSMAAPVVTGTVALMLQANPSLTPNLVKAILQYTSQVYDAYDPLTEGAGFLNAKGAIDLARDLAAGGAPYPAPQDWSRRVIWGNYLLRDGVLAADANAWPAAITWGAASSPDGARIGWGWTCRTLVCDPADASDWSAWQMPCTGLLCQLLGTSSATYPNVVWGSACGGGDCQVPWTTTLVSGSTADGDTVVWGTGTADGDTVVWGTTSDGDTVVWGTSCADPSCAPVVWGGS